MLSMRLPVTFFILTGKLAMAVHEEPVTHDLQPQDEKQPLAKHQQKVQMEVGIATATENAAPHKLPPQAKPLMRKFQPLAEVNHDVGTEALLEAGDDHAMTSANVTVLANATSDLTPAEIANMTEAHTTEAPAPAPTSCLVPDVHVGIHEWHGADEHNPCQKNINMTIGTICKVDPIPGWHCISPGKCQPDGTFSMADTAGCTRVVRPCPSTYPHCKHFRGWQRLGDGNKVRFDNGNHDCVIEECAAWENDAEWKYAPSSSTLPGHHYNRVHGFNNTVGLDCTEDHGASPS